MVGWISAAPRALSTFFCQTLWPPGPPPPDLLPGLRVAAILLAAKMRTSPEEASHWIASIASLPEEAALMETDILLCGSIPSLHPPSSFRRGSLSHLLHLGSHPKLLLPRTCRSPD